MVKLVIVIYMKCIFLYNVELDPQK